MWLPLFDSICPHTFRRCHPGPGPPGSVGTGPSLAIQPIQVEYFGHTYAHFQPQRNVIRESSQTIQCTRLRCSMGSRKRSGCRVPRLLERIRSPPTDETRPSRTRDRRGKGLGSQQYACDKIRMEFSVLTSLFLVIPDYAKMRWFVRAPTGAQLKVWRDRVVKCFELVPFDCRSSPLSTYKRAIHTGLPRTRQDANTLSPTASSCMIFSKIQYSVSFGGY